VSEAPIGALSGPQKAAVLLLSFSSAESAELISRLSPREAELLAEQLARAREVDAGTRRRVLEDFRRAADEPGSPHPHSSATADPAEKAVGPGAAERQAAPEAAGDGVRVYDLGRLERVPRSALAKRALAVGPDLSRLADLPVRCRAQLARLSLTLADLQHLAEGDVLLLGPAAEASAELTAGERCRLPCRLVRRGLRRAVELLPTPELPRAVELLPAPELPRAVELLPAASEGEEP
jgi:flagellar motor switch/type III secretory pathway protein FliN